MDDIYNLTHNMTSLLIGMEINRYASHQRYAICPKPSCNTRNAVIGEFLYETADENVCYNCETPLRTRPIATPTGTKYELIIG